MSIGNDDATVKRGIDVILTETDRLSKLVEELLDFSRLQSGNFKINMMTVEVMPILTEAVSMYNQLARKQGIDISYIESGAKILVTADRDRLKQVFINIIDNAVKYTSVGGRVIVSSELDERTVKIIIQDTGIGIKKEDLAHVKERFYKANKTVRGSGIGLAVADEIIKQHNGFILVDSIENVGTTVTVVLPIETNQTERIEKENNG
jgi:signal transduction histidine kinase